MKKDAVIPIETKEILRVENGEHRSLKESDFDVSDKLTEEIHESSQTTSLH